MDDSLTWLHRKWPVPLQDEYDNCQLENQIKHLFNILNAQPSRQLDNLQILILLQCRESDPVNIHAIIRKITFNQPQGGGKRKSGLLTMKAGDGNPACFSLQFHLVLSEPVVTYHQRRNAFVHYVMSRRSQDPMPGNSNMENIQVWAREWASLSAQQKETFADQAKAAPRRVRSQYAAGYKMCAEMDPSSVGWGSTRLCELWFVSRANDRRHPVSTDKFKFEVKRDIINPHVEQCCVGRQLANILQDIGMSTSLLRIIVEYV